jgi:hypothetical protein
MKKNKKNVEVGPNLSKNHFMKSITDLFLYLNKNIYSLNNSKLFAGLMIIILNISSKFVTIKLSKTMESYLKYSFSRNILVFAIAWMGTRDIYIAFLITILFILLMDFLFNEDSDFCCLPEQFTDYHVSLLDEKVSEEDIKKANEILEKAKKQKEEELRQGGNQGSGQNSGQNSGQMQY